MADTNKKNETNLVRSQSRFFFLKLSVDGYGCSSLTIYSVMSLSLSLSPPPSLPPSLQGGNRPMMADDSDEEFDPVGGVPTDSELDKVKTVS